MSDPVRRPMPVEGGRRGVVTAQGAFVALSLICLVYGVYCGWRTFWFLTDDAFIAFRYVSNSLLGHGWVWNPPPFQPVEGYTSFLWVLLLDVVWRATGVLPPDSANWLSLGFGLATLYVGYRFVSRMTLPAGHERIRGLLLVLIALGTVSNRTFLTWLSSGLETSLFNFAVSCWIYFALTAWGDRGGQPSRSERVSLLGLTGSAAAVALTRPDGLLFCAATLVLLALREWGAKGGLSQRWRRLVWGAPLLLVPLHLLWRFQTYGMWLPNTYYAKVSEPWPEAGLRHLACFALEYGLWVWLVFALAAWAAWARSGKPDHRVAATGEPGKRGEVGRGRWGRASVGIVVAVLVGQVGYYSLNVGGDHFEYRVYSYLIPWLFISGGWLAARCARPGICLLLVALFVIVSWPIPWLHWSLTRDLATRAETRTLIVPIAAEFPPGVRRVVAQWDEWQAWLILRSVGRRHQEHKIAYQAGALFWPTREEGARIGWEERAVLAIGGVGVAAWALPNVAIIDEFGLNDRVIASNPAERRKPGTARQMAHERLPPERYVECFMPNVVQPYLFSSGCMEELMQRPVSPGPVGAGAGLREGSLWRGTARQSVAVHRWEGQLSEADFGSCDRLIVVKRPIELKDARIRACEQRAWY